MSATSLRRAACDPEPRELLIDGDPQLADDRLQGG